MSKFKACIPSLLFLILPWIFFSSAIAEEMKVPFNIPWYRGKIEGYLSQKDVFTTLYRDRYLMIDRCGNNVVKESREGIGRHPGIDIAVISGTNVIAPWYGEIVYAGDKNDGWGGLIIMKSSELPGLNPEEVRYFIWAHNKEWYVKTGDIITKDQFINPKTDNAGNFLPYRSDTENGPIIGGIVIAKTGGDKNDPHHGKSTGSHSHFQGDLIEQGAPYWPKIPAWVIDKKAYNYFYSDILKEYSSANIPDDFNFYNDNRDNTCLFEPTPPALTETQYVDNKFPITRNTFNPLEFIQERTNIGKFSGGGEFGVIKEPSSRIMYSDFFAYGGYEYFGFPANFTPWLGDDGVRVHEAWGRLSQDFAGGKTGRTLFVWNNWQQRSYPVTMGFLDIYFWMNNNGYDTGTPMEKEIKMPDYNTTQKFQNESNGAITYTFHYDNTSICAWATDIYGREVNGSKKCWDERKRESLKLIFITNHFESGIGGGGLSNQDDKPNAPSSLRVN